MTRVRSDRRRGAEQTRVPRDAAERRGILIVHLAHEQAPAPRIDPGRRNPRVPQLRRSELNFLDDVHLRQHPGEAVGQRHASMDDEAEQDEVEIAVDGLAARWIVERLGANRPLVHLPAACPE